MEVEAKHVSKEQALHEVHHQVPLEEVMTVGDLQWPSMLRLKQDSASYRLMPLRLSQTEAKTVTKSNNEHGVIEAIKEYVLGWVCEMLEIGKLHSSKKPPQKVVFLSFVHYSACELVREVNVLKTFTLPYDPASFTPPKASKGTKPKHWLQDRAPCLTQLVYKSSSKLSVTYELSKYWKYFKLYNNVTILKVTILQYQQVILFPKIIISPNAVTNIGKATSPLK